MISQPDHGLIRSTPSRFFAIPAALPIRRA
jgi:hypothetical protein